MFTDDSGFYRPWQFADYNVEAVTLNTTYEEIYIWLKEKANVREGFRVKDLTVVIPNMFSKVCGTHEDIDAYWKEINQVATQKYTKFYTEIPIMNVVHLEYGMFDQIYPSNVFSEFNTQEMLNSSWWKLQGAQVWTSKKHC